MATASPPVIGKATLLLVDDEPQQLELLREWFLLHGHEVATANSGLAAIHLLKQRLFDVVITDMMMPGMSGLDLISCLREWDSRVAIVVLSGQGTMENAIAALREGQAFDYVQKPVNLSQLSQVVLRAFEHSKAKGVQSATGSGPLTMPEHVEALTPREAEIMACLAEGLENRLIADRLSVSEKTIKNHLTRVFEKLKVKNRTHALLVCQQYGLL